MKLLHLILCLSFLVIPLMAEEQVETPEDSSDNNMAFGNPFCPPGSPFATMNGTAEPVRAGAAKTQLQHWIDCGALLIMLTLASWALFFKKSRAITIVFMFLSLAYFGFWRHGCICPLGAIGNISAALSQKAGLISIFAIIFFILPLFFALLIGRVFCGSICPFGIIQEFVGMKTVKVPKLIDNILRLLKYVVLGVILYYAIVPKEFILCKYDPFIPILRLTGSNSQWLMAISIIALSVVIARPFCRWLCPYAVFLGWISKISFLSRKIDLEKCISCKKCQNVCPTNSITLPIVDNSKCIVCNKCKQVCPKDCIDI